MLFRSGEWVAYRDRAAGRYRFAVLRDGRIDACLFIAPTPQLPPRAWLGSLFKQDRLSAADRLGLVTGQPPASTADSGTVVCSCNSVGQNRIVAAIRGRRLTSVAAIGEATTAGTGCGSCKPELAALLASTVVGAD